MYKAAINTINEKVSSCLIRRILLFLARRIRYRQDRVRNKRCAIKQGVRKTTAVIPLPLLSRCIDQRDSHAWYPTSFYFIEPSPRRRTATLSNLFLPRPDTKRDENEFPSSIGETRHARIKRERLLEMQTGADILTRRMPTGRDK